MIIMISYYERLDISGTHFHEMAARDGERRRRVCNVTRRFVRITNRAGSMIHGSE